MKNNNVFSRDVCMLVGQIPVGRVMTYGQIASLCGHPRAARIVGGIAHYSAGDLPWHRVVNKQGGLASGFPGGRRTQKAMLEAEHVMVGHDDKVNVTSLIWWPEVSKGSIHGT